MSFPLLNLRCREYGRDIPYPMGISAYPRDYIQGALVGSPQSPPDLRRLRAPAAGRLAQPNASPRGYRPYVALPHTRILRVRSRFLPVQISRPAPSKPAAVLPLDRLPAESR